LRGGKWKDTNKQDGLAHDCGPDDGNGQVRDDRCGPNDKPFGKPRAVSLHHRPSDPIMGRLFRRLAPDRSRIRPKSSCARRLRNSRAVGAGAPPRLGQGHPSSAPRRSDPPIDRARPPLAEGQGCGLPAPE